MTSTSEQKLNQIWYGNQSPSAWQRLLVPLYRQAQRFDRWRKKPVQSDVLGRAFIIVVGNITVGGAGKTPLVIRLCRLFSENGVKAGVISRGYGRKSKGMRLVSPSSEPDTVGDEPLLIAQRAQVPVLVSADRVAAAETLAEKGIRVIIADDGLQHYRLPRNLEICVIDGNRGLGNGLMLPAGPLREPLDRLSTVDDLVVNGDPDLLPGDWQRRLDTYGPLRHMHLVPGWLRSLDSGQSWRLSQFSGCRVNAVAGIGNPDRFFELLRHSRIQVNEFAFPDHHDYKNTDFDVMDPDLPILMTEKDAVKCRRMNLRNAWVLSVDAVMPQDWEQLLMLKVGEHLSGSSA